jgi:alpha-methylacyl-CoA racemase
MSPLNGLRIVEFDGLGPVTFLGMVLADLGADVVRLTRADSAGAAVFTEVGGAILHRGRAAVPVNLKDEEDRARVLDLLARSDGLIEGFRPGVMERLGLGPEACLARNPALVFARVTGWGQTGPLAPAVGHDINYLALSGALSTFGEADRPARPPLNLVGDYAGGALMGAIGLLSGLLQARTTGKGTVIDVAMTDGVALMTALFHALKARGLWTDQRDANLLDGSTPFYRCYRCRDGGEVAVGALEPRFYAALLAGLELSADDAPQYDRTRWPEISGRFAAIFATRDRDDWTARFEGTEACVTPVLTLGEAVTHAHNQSRGTFDAAGAPAPAPVFDGVRPGAGAPERTEIPLVDALERWSRPTAAI